MSLDAIKQINEIEKQADQLVQDAKVKAREIISQAQKDAAALREKIIEESNEKALGAIRDGQKQGERAAQADIKQAEEKCRDIRQEAESRMDDAVSLIVRRIVKS